MFLTHDSTAVFKEVIGWSDIDVAVSCLQKETYVSWLNRVWT